MMRSPVSPGMSAVWMLAAWAVGVGASEAGQSFVGIGVGPEPAYPAAVYPQAVESILKKSEVPYEESASTRSFGYNVAFPAGPRRRLAVDDFGAKPDGVTDCTPAFYRAMAAARSAGDPAELVFRETGRYYFPPDANAGSDEWSILNLHRMTNLRIRGQGFRTVLMIGDPALGGLSVVDCQTIELCDFAVDYCPLPFTQGAVAAVDRKAGAFVMRVHDGYPSPEALRRAIPGHHGGYRIFSTGAFKWAPIGPLGIRDVAPQETACRFTVDPPASVESLHKGDEFVYVGRRLAQQAIHIRSTRDFHLHRVTVHASPTCGLGLLNVDGAHIDAYADTPPPGSNRLLATNADGIFCHNVRGGITVKDCYFRGQGDDCVNLHCSALWGRQIVVENDGTVTIRAEIDLRPGDQLEVMDPTTDRIKGSVAVVSVRRTDRHRLECRLDRPLAAVGHVPTTDRVYPVDWAAPNFKIVHNYLGQNRSRGLIIQGRRGIIEANTFENAEGYGVFLGYGGTEWPEGVIPADVTIRRNVFRNVTGVGQAAPIEAFGGNSSRNLKNITIENNRFLEPRKLAIKIVGGENIRLIDNSVTTSLGRRNTWNHPTYYPVDCSVYLDNVTGARIDRFTLRDANIRGAGLYIGPACDPGARGVDVRNFQAELPPGIAATKDSRPPAGESHR